MRTTLSRRYTKTPLSAAHSIFDLFQALLLLRLLFIFFGANPGNGGVSFVTGFTDPIVAPFRSIFSATTIGSFTLDWATLDALIIYALCSHIAMQLIYFFVGPVKFPSTLSLSRRRS